MHIYAIVNLLFVVEAIIVIRVEVRDNATAVSLSEMTNTIVPTKYKSVTHLRSLEKDHEARK